MFVDCQSLTSVMFSGNLTDICLDSFRGCNSLTSLTIPNGATKFSIITYGDRELLTGKSVTIHAPAGSHVEVFAKEHNISFEAL